MVKIQDYRSRFGFHLTPFTREIAVTDRFPLPEFDQVIEAVLRTLDARMSCAIIAPSWRTTVSPLESIWRIRLPSATRNKSSDAA